MSRELDIHDIDFWWDKKAFIRTLVVCVLTYAALMLWIEHVKPPEGHVFERLPPITGVWKCCKGDGRYGKSWVGNTQVTCGVPSYYGFGGASDCGMARVPNGAVTSVTKALYPTWYGQDSYVSKIESNGQAYWDRDSDESIRKKWIKGSRMDAWDVFVYMFIILYFVQLAVRKTNRN